MYVSKTMYHKMYHKNSGTEIFVETRWPFQFIYLQYLIFITSICLHFKVYLLYEYTLICIIIIIFINIQYVQVCEMGQNNYYFLVFRLTLRFNSQRAAAKIIVTILVFLIELKGPGKNKIRKKYRLLSGKDGGFTYQTVR